MSSLVHKKIDDDEVGEGEDDDIPEEKTLDDIIDAYKKRKKM